MEEPLNWPHQRTLYSQDPAGAENSELVVSVDQNMKYSSPLVHSEMISQAKSIISFIILNYFLNVPAYENEPGGSKSLGQSVMTI